MVRELIWNLSNVYELTKYSFTIMVMNISSLKRYHHRPEQLSVQSMKAQEVHLKS